MSANHAICDCLSKYNFLSYIMSVPSCAKNDAYGSAPALLCSLISTCTSVQSDQHFGFTQHM